MIQFCLNPKTLKPKIIVQYEKLIGIMRFAKVYNLQCY